MDSDFQFLNRRHKLHIVLKVTRHTVQYSITGLNEIVCVWSSSDSEQFFYTQAYCNFQELIIYFTFM